MRYKIKDIPEEGLELDLSLESSFLVEVLQDALPVPERCSVGGHLSVQLDRANLFVRGRLEGQLEVSCSRCLGPAIVKVDLPVSAVVTPDPGGMPDEQENEWHHDGKTLDLTDLLRETVILALPMTPHCSEGCKGLCVSCGENLNERDCGHRPVALPERKNPFSKLAEKKTSSAKPN